MDPPCADKPVRLCVCDIGKHKQSNMRASASALCRAKEPIKTTRQLVNAVGQTRLPGAKARRKPGNKAAHPATRTFQALRIAVNDELHAIEDAMPAAIAALRPGGRLAVLTFHSLEDRIVKRAMRAAAGLGGAQSEQEAQMARFAMSQEEEQEPAILKLVSRKPVTASPAELDENPRARSAKLRVVEKLPFHGAARR